MRKIRAIFLREYVATVHTKAFVVAVILMPVLVLASVAIPVLAERHADADVRRCAVVDRAGGEVLAALKVAAAVRNAKVKTGQDAGARFEIVAPSTEEMARDPDALGLDLSDQVRRGVLFAFVEIDADVLEQGSDATRYYTNTPTYTKLHAWLHENVELTVHRMRMRSLGIDVDKVERASAPVRMRYAALYSAEQPERGVAETEAEPLRDAVFPLVIAMLMFMAVMSSAGPLMQSVLEEKMQRIAEVLVSSVPPFQLMLGKLLAASAVAHTLLLLYIGTGAYALVRLDATHIIDWGDLAWGLSFQGIALLMYGSIFLAVGSACTDLKSSQNLMMPAMMVAAAPMLLLPLVLTDPNGGLATTVSLIPFFTPVLMLMRITLDPGAPAWQAVLGIVLSGSTALGCVWAASRVFRVGMLSQGATPSLAELWRWIRHG